MHGVGLDDHQIRSQCRDGFEIRIGVIADFGFQLRFRRVAAEAGDSHDAIAQAESVQDFGDARRGGNDSLGLTRELRSNQHRAGER